MKNTYFEEMRKESAIWAEAKKERQTRRAQIIEEYGWDSEELTAWESEEEAAPEYPFKAGEVKACRAWKNSQEEGMDEVEMNDFLGNNEAHDFIEAFRKAGIKTFVYTNKGSACMDNLHELAGEGCTLEGLAKITKKETRWSGEKTSEVRGVRFSID